MINIKKLLAPPVPNGLGKYPAETIFFVKQESVVSIYISDSTGDAVYQLNTGSGGGGAAMTTYYIAANGTLPPGNPGDVVIETTNGGSSGVAIRAWMKQSTGGFKLIAGSRRVMHGVVSSTIGDPTLATVSAGRYIVPTAGLSGTFVGHANQLAYYNGNVHIFEDANVDDVCYVASGADSGKYLKWTGSAWVVDTTYDYAGVYNWSLDRVFSAGDVVNYGNSLYIANDNIPSNTAFVIGLAGSTWSPVSTYKKSSGLTGEVVLSTKVQLLSSTPVDIATIPIPSKGVWKIESIIRGTTDQTVTKANGVSFAIYDDQGAVVANSETKASHGSTPEGYQATGFGKTFVTTTDARTYKLKAWRTGNAGTPWILSDSDGRSKVMFERFADE